MKTFRLFLLVGLVPFFSCQEPIEKHAAHYREHQDAASLQEVVKLFPQEADTSDVRTLLGEPIDFGFDYRYMTEEVSENNCAVGAVFHIDEEGKVDDFWYGEICE